MNLSYGGKLGQLYKIWFKNLFLQIITICIYRPWAKTKIRKYLFGSIAIFGDNLEYSGTGRELFRGSCKAFLIILAFSILGYAIVTASFDNKGAETYGDDVTNTISSIVLVFLIYYSQFSSLRYKLGRLRWRSIRANLGGSGFKYVLLRLRRAILSCLSLGFLMGRSDILARKYMIERISIGSVKFSFDGSHKALDWANFFSLLLAIPTLMLSRVWYANKRRNYIWSSIRIGQGIKITSTFGFRKTLGLYFGNLFIIIFTLGLGIPICLNRSVKFLATNINIEGEPEEIEALQSQYASATGDAMSDLLDDSGGLDFDFSIW